MIKLYIILLAAAVTCTTVFAAETVKMAVGDWAPYTSESDISGKLTEKIVTEAFKLEGITVIYEYYPWKRSLEMVRSGMADGTFPWNKADDKINDFYFNSEVLLKDDGVYFHLKTTKFKWNTIQDLKKYKVGVTIGYKDEKRYEDIGILTDKAPSEEMNFRKLLAGRIDVYHTSKIVGYAAIAKLFTPEEAKLITNHPKIVTTNKYFILFSKKTPNGRMFAEKFDSGFKKLKASGRYRQILEESGSR